MFVIAVRSLLLVTQLLLRNAMARQAPAWRFLILQAGACTAGALPSGAW